MVNSKPGQCPRELHRERLALLAAGLNKGGGLRVGLGRIIAQVRDDYERTGVIAYADSEVEEAVVTYNEVLRDGTPPEIAVIRARGAFLSRVLTAGAMENLLPALANERANGKVGIYYDYARNDGASEFMALTFELLTKLPMVLRSEISHQLSDDHILNWQTIDRILMEGYEKNGLIDPEARDMFFHRYRKDLGGNSAADLSYSDVVLQAAVVHTHFSNSETLYDDLLEGLRAGVSVSVALAECLYRKVRKLSDPDPDKVKASFTVENLFPLVAVYASSPGQITNRLEEASFEDCRIETFNRVPKGDFNDDHFDLVELQNSYRLVPSEELLRIAEELGCTSMQSTKCPFMTAKHEDANGVRHLLRWICDLIQMKML